MFYIFIENLYKSLILNLVINSFKKNKPVLKQKIDHSTELDIDLLP